MYLTSTPYASQQYWKNAIFCGPLLFPQSELIKISWWPKPFFQYPALAAGGGEGCEEGRAPAEPSVCWWPGQAWRWSQNCDQFKRKRPQDQSDTLSVPSWDISRPVRVHPLCLLLHLLPLLLVEWRQVRSENFKSYLWPPMKRNSIFKLSETGWWPSMQVPGTCSADAGLPLDHWFQVFMFFYATDFGGKISLKRYWALPILSPLPNVFPL